MTARVVGRWLLAAASVVVWGLLAGGMLYVAGAR